MRKKGNKISTILLFVILLVGLSVMLYPIISNWWNERVQTKAIASYDKAVENLDDSEYEKLLERAHEYNKKLAELKSPLVSYDEISGYEEILDVSGNGIMGYITIPEIQVQLPIYHGTSVEVLNIAVGHLQGSSLPVGGESTHAVISAHRGLPSAKLFSDLDQLDKGDEFTITILNEIYTYEVDEISIVLPDNTQNLSIISGEDYVTLMTCTPYGVNSHRLLVRAHRIETIYPHNVKVSADAVQLDPLVVVPVIMAPLLVILVISWFFKGNRKKAFKSKDLLLTLDDNQKIKNDNTP